MFIVDLVAIAIPVCAAAFVVAAEPDDNSDDDGSDAGGDDGGDLVPVAS